MLSSGPDPKSIFSPFDLESRKSVVAAVSGGSDSTALLVLLSEWLAVAAPQVRLIAVTVDHRLRPESASEADAVARFCGAMGIAHRIVAWGDAKPSTGLPEAARLVRYRLLADAARDLGTDIVLTGHTIDDQFETVEMRLQRGGGRGLAGMSTATLFAGRCWILRPLLASRREALRRLLSAKRVGWAEDPTNQDIRYERARLRAARTGDDAGAIVCIAAAQARRRVLGATAAGLIEVAADRPVPGLIRLTQGFLAAADHAAAIYALRILLAVVGGSRQLPDAERSARLFDRLAAGPRTRATLSRCVADRRGPRLYLHRELRDLPALVLGEGEGEWDARFRVAGPAGSVVRAAGACDIAGDAAPDGVPLSLVRAATAAQPVLCAGETERLIAGAGASPLANATPILAPWALFLPDFDLVPATAVSRLIGAEEPPLPPFTGHKHISA